MLPIKIAGTAFAVTLCVTPAMAQNAPPNAPVNLYVGCIKEAIDHVDDLGVSRVGYPSDAMNGRAIRFNCAGDPAKRLFEYLKSRNLPAQVINNHNGHLITIGTESPSPPGRDSWCTHQVADANGRPINAYHCFLHMIVGPNFN